MTSFEYVGWKNACLPRLYYTQLDSTKRNAVAVTEHSFFTEHGAQHSQLAVGSSVRLHSAAQSADPFIGASDRPENIVTTQVVHVNAFADLIILKAVGGDRFYEQDGHVMAKPLDGTEYLLISINNNVLAVKHGNVISAIPNSQGHIRGTSGSDKGDSGGAVCNRAGEVIGMCIAVDKLPVQGSSDARGPYVHQSGDRMIFCSAENIAFSLGMLGESVTLELPELEI
uniref:Uncharacterized protein n=1 Tax=Ditylenchus dipsaci TaxID=166011 RepID=A0A915EJ50_9BILA